MEKEKILLGNGTMLSYDSIAVQGGYLIVGFAGGDMAALEQAFRAAGQNNLESIQQMDAEGNEQTVHQRFDIFKEVRKQIGIDGAEDVVSVILQQESETDMKIRHLTEVTDTLLMNQLELA